MSEPVVHVRFVATGVQDALAQPLLAELVDEYSGRYEIPRERMMPWLTSDPDQYAPPSGGLFVGLLDGLPVTGGAFVRFDDTTAELKRIWTDSDHRQRGLAKALLAHLESEIAARGYRRIYLTTGHRQPEAEALYESAGYTRLVVELPAEGDGTVLPIAFEKVLP